MSMLRAHYVCRTLSTRRIASFGGYLHPEDGNFQYVGLAGRIARELGFATPGQQMHAIAETVPERDIESEWQWRLDDVLVKAPDEARWFSNVAEEAPERMQSKGVPETERPCPQRIPLAVVSATLESPRPPIYMRPEFLTYQLLRCCCCR